MLGDIISSTMRGIADLVTTWGRSLELVEPEVLLQQHCRKSQRALIVVYNNEFRVGSYPTSASITSLFISPHEVVPKHGGEKMNKPMEETTDLMHEYLDGKRLASILKGMGL